MSEFVKTHLIGELNESDSEAFKHIFTKHYTPDEPKYHAQTITSIAIVLDPYQRKCFSMCVDGVWYPSAIKRLAGSTRDKKANLVRATRLAIQPDIDEFRSNHILNPTDTCPVTNKPLGKDAQVDHQIPFNVLLTEWLDKGNENATFIYDLDVMNYILLEPFLRTWTQFHAEKAVLRWVSKEGNQYAHKLYVK